MEKSYGLIFTHLGEDPVSRRLRKQKKYGKNFLQKMKIILVLLQTDLIGHLIVVRDGQKNLA